MAPVRLRRAGRVGGSDVDLVFAEGKALAERSGDLRSFAILPPHQARKACHLANGAGSRRSRRLCRESRWVTPGILPFALRASLRLFKIAPGDFVRELRCAPDGGRSGLASRRSAAPTTHAAMGAKRAVRIALSIRH